MNKENESMLDEMLSYAAGLRMEEIADECTPEGDIDISPRLEKRLSRIINRQKLLSRFRISRKSALKAGAVVALHIVLLTAVALHVGAVAARPLEIHGVAGDRYDTVYVKESYEKKAPESSGIYIPTYIPHGFAVESIDKEDALYTVSFAGPGGTTLTLKKLGLNSTVEIVGAEEFRPISVDDEPAQLAVKDGVLTLVFEYDENAFMLTGPVGEDEMEKVAQSMKVNETL